MTPPPRPDGLTAPTPCRAPLGYDPEGAVSRWRARWGEVGVRGRWVLATAVGWGGVGAAYAGVGVDRLVLGLQSVVPCQVPALGVGDAVLAHLWVAGTFTLQSLALLLAWQVRAWAPRAPRAPGASRERAERAAAFPPAPAPAPWPWGLGVWALGSVALTGLTAEAYPRLWPLLDPSPLDSLPSLVSPSGEEGAEAPRTLAVPIWSRLALVRGWGRTWLVLQALWLGAWWAAGARLGAAPRRVSPALGREGPLGPLGTPRVHAGARRAGWGGLAVLALLAVGLGALPGPLGGAEAGVAGFGSLALLGETALMARAWAATAAPRPGPRPEPRPRARLRTGAKDRGHVGPRV